MTGTTPTTIFIVSVDQAAVVEAVPATTMKMLEVVVPVVVASFEGYPIKRLLAQRLFKSVLRVLREHKMGVLVEQVQTLSGKRQRLSTPLTVRVVLEARVLVRRLIMERVESVVLAE